MSYAFDTELAPWVVRMPSIDYTDLAAARAILDGIVARQPPSPVADRVEVSDHRIPGAGASPVRVRVYRPRGATGPLPGLIYLHWGGFVFGDLETVHTTALRLADEVGAMVINVAYRLAPEHPFPAGLEDCYAALAWAAGHAAELGLDPARLAVGGESAGGGLAAALTLLARDRGGPALAFQCLLYPALDDRLTTPSAVAFTDTPKWDRGSAELSWRYYLSGTDRDAVSPYAAPARAMDVSGLPPAFVAVCEFDPLRDEGIVYARRLDEAGVAADVHTYPGTFHASISIAEAAVSRRMMNDQAESLRKALHV